MSKFLDNSDINYALNIVDTREPDFKNKNKRVTYTQSDFFKLSKKEFAADAVINTDVLEHIPKNLKIKFVKQCIDFSNAITIISAPQDTEAVTAAEKKIDILYQEYTGQSQRWLKEHFEYGKPNAKSIAKTITDLGYPFLELNTNNLENWFTSFSLNLINSEVQPLEGMDELNRLYNKNIHSNGDFDGEAYRKIFIVFKDKKLFAEKKDELEKFFAPSSKTKSEYTQKVYETIAKNFSQTNALVKKMELVEKNLAQTQDAFVSATNELNEIKGSRLYKQLVRLKNAKQKLF